MREMPWFFRVVSPIAFAVALSLGFVRISIGAQFAEIDATLWGETGVFVPLLLAPVVSCVLVSWRTTGRERQAWWLLGLGVGMMGVADMAATRYGGTPGPALAPGYTWPTGLWLLALIPHLHALVSFLDTPWTIRSVRSRHIVDIGYSVLLTSLSAFAIAVTPAFGQLPEKPAGAALANFFAMTCGVGILSYAGVRRPRLRFWHLFLLGAALLVVAGGTFGFSAISLDRVDPRAPELAFLPWALAYLCVAAAGIARMISLRHSPREYIVYAEEPSFAPGMIATIALYLLLPVFVYQITAWQGTRLCYVVYSLVLTLCILASVGRNVLIVTENWHLRRRSTTDPLTGLSNHRHFHERLETEITRSARERIPLSIAVLDVDSFNKVNNVYGHRTGDLRLRSIAAGITANSRGFDIACRIGGDEFALIMPNTTSVEAYGVCLRFQEKMEQPDGVCDLPSSLSIGIASYPEHARSRDALVRRADGALYWAKYHGRRQVVIYNPELVQALGPEQRIELLEEEAYVKMVQLLAAAVDARDPYTRLHSSHVAELANAFSAELGIDPAHRKLIETAALLHDVGKVGVTDDVLCKPGTLSEDEMDLVREHPCLAENILGSIPKRQILPWIRGHHERWDGTGYPDGLRGEAIPFEARLLSLCDAYDAMTTNRVYRTALPPQAACEEIIRSAGSQFDPCLASRFVQTVMCDSIVSRLSDHHRDAEPEPDEQLEARAHGRV